MPNNKEGKVLFVRDGYCFIKQGNKIIVATKRKNEEELEVITTLLQQWKAEQIPRYRGRPLTGEFHLCRNPECINAFYAFRGRIERGLSLTCSRLCRGKVFGCRKGFQLGQPNSRPEKIATLNREPPRIVGFQVGGFAVDRNPESSVYGKVGIVVSVGPKEVKVDFGEKGEFGKGRVLSVYIKRSTLRHIAPRKRVVKKLKISYEKAEALV